LESLDSRLDSVERLLSSVCEDEEGSRVHLEQTGDVGHVVSGGDVDFRSVFGGACRQEMSLITAASASDEVTAQSMDNEQQRPDPELEKITVRLEKGEGVPGYSLSRDVLCWVPSRGGGQKIVVPTAAVPMVCEYFHTSPVGGHLGV
jgi:hypothetical protein